MRLLFFCYCLSIAISAVAQTALDEYIQKPDTSYSWQILDKDEDILASTYALKLVSQQWRNAQEVDQAIWEHEIFVFVPNFNLCQFNNSPETAILLITGGGNPVDGKLDSETSAGAQVLANSMCSVLAVLKQVPNQPLYFSDEINRRRTEDEILSYSFNKFLETGDDEWPVHLAMTKATVRAMDALQEFSRQEIDKVNISDFIVMGGSKRGWTTWLTAAVDNRVKAIIPISIDMLSLEQQFRHHWEVYGFYTPAVNDYVEYDLPCRVPEPGGQELLDIVDPYAYRERLTIPKLVINSAGDQFFVSDSSQFYYSQLPGPKWLRYTANTDHAQGDEEDILDLFLSARSWIDDINSGKQPPEFDWQFMADGSIQVQTVEKPKRVTLWQAYNPEARDFRQESIGKVWSASPLSDQGNGLYSGSVSSPTRGFKAFFIEVEFEENGLFEQHQKFTTDIRVTPDNLPFIDTACPQFPDYSNLWWNPNFPGQAVQLYQQGNTLAGAWYLYDEQGQPMWVTFVAPINETSASGSLLRFTGPALGAPWEVQQVQSQSVGNVRVDFRSASSATMHYTLNGVPGRLELVPFERLAEPGITGVWSDVTRSGQGVQLLHAKQSIGGVIYTYDENGNGFWATFLGQLQNDKLNAELLRYSGPALGAEWYPEHVRYTSIGRVELEVLSATAMTFSYTIGVVTEQLNLTPARF